jgi:hypothetical protein
MASMLRFMFSYGKQTGSLIFGPFYRVAFFYFFYILVIPDYEHMIPIYFFSGSVFVNNSTLLSYFLFLSIDLRCNIYFLLEFSWYMEQAVLYLQDRRFIYMLMIGHFNTSMVYCITAMR